MPAYDFKCTVCDQVFEITRPSDERSPVTCPACESAAKRVFTPIGVHFKGSGFYNTDRHAASSTPAADTTPATTPPAPVPTCPASTGGGCAGCPAAE